MTSAVIEVHKMSLLCLFYLFRKVAQKMFRNIMFFLSSLIKKRLKIVYFVNHLQKAYESTKYNPVINYGLLWKLLQKCSLELSLYLYIELFKIRSLETKMKYINQYLISYQISRPRGTLNSKNVVLIYQLFINFGSSIKTAFSIINILFIKRVCINTLFIL